ncbi:hypothetical protein LR090_04235, partial [Candidatus Bipolaricaulota bacterium]|nr:hypothetical protein [Candidatus Bipolaricaulota bacterium]
MDELDLLRHRPAPDIRGQPLRVRAQVGVLVEVEADLVAAGLEVGEAPASQVGGHYGDWTWITNRPPWRSTTSASP